MIGRQVYLWMFSIWSIEITISQNQYLNIRSSLSRFIQLTFLAALFCVLPFCLLFLPLSLYFAFFLLLSVFLSLSHTHSPALPSLYAGLLLFIALDLSFSPLRTLPTLPLPPRAFASPHAHGPVHPFLCSMCQPNHSHTHSHS